MFPNTLAGTSSFGFPIINNVGSLKQVLPDSTEMVLSFGGNATAPGTSYLQLQQSVGGAGPWSFLGPQIAFTLTGGPQSNYSYSPYGPYSKNNYFRARWTNENLGFTSEWSYFADHTLREAWDVSTYPIAPASIDGISVSGGPSSGVGHVTIHHSLLDAANYSDMGIKVTIQVDYNNGGPTFSKSVSAFFSGWGASTVFAQTYDIPIPDATNVTAATGASAQYYVLGSPPPGILGTVLNY